MRTIGIAILAALLGFSQTAPAGNAEAELEELMANFVQGWREGDAELLGTVFAMAEWS